MQRIPEPCAEARVNRRSLYTVLIYGLWSLMAAALGAPALVYLLFPPKVRRQPEWVEAGDVSGLAPHTPVEMVFRRNRVDGWKVLSEKSTAWVVRLDSGRLEAFGPQCTHLGCAYRWDENKSHFVCPCHSSIFSMEGKVVAGPAPRPLDQYETRVENGKLLLGRLEIPGVQKR